MDEDRLKERRFLFSDRFAGILKGYKLIFNKINDRVRRAGYANIIKDLNSRVEGIIYETDEKSLSNLDIFEVVPTEYIRKIVQINAKNNKIYCITYVASLNRTKEGLRPTKEYLSHLLKGKQFLSDKYFKMLLAIKTID